MLLREGLCINDYSISYSKIDEEGYWDVYGPKYLRTVRVFVLCNEYHSWRIGITSLFILKDH